MSATSSRKEAALEARLEAEKIKVISEPITDPEAHRWICRRWTWPENFPPPPGSTVGECSACGSRILHVLTAPPAIPKLCLECAEAAEREQLERTGVAPEHCLTVEALQILRAFARADEEEESSAEKTDKALD